MKRCIVTGATGMIGNDICDRLGREGWQIIPVSRVLPRDWMHRMQAIEGIEADVTSDQFATMQVRADALIHLAAANDIVSRDARKGIELSVLGTRNALELAVLNGIERFIFFSTIQVLGSELTGRITEETPVNPQNDYAMNHLLAEWYVQMYARQQQLRAVTVRPTNVYGRFPSATIKRWSLVPACFCLEAYRHGTITLRSSGRQTRNFVSASYVAAATEAILTHMDADYDLVHIGSSCQMSIVETARIVQQVYRARYGKEVPLTVQSEVPAESNTFHLSTEKLAVKYGCREANYSSSMLQEIEGLFHKLETEGAVQ